MRKSRRIRIYRPREGSVPPDVIYRGYGIHAMSMEGPYRIYKLREGCLLLDEYVDVEAAKRAINALVSLITKLRHGVEVTAKTGIETAKGINHVRRMLG